MAEDRKYYWLKLKEDFFDEKQIKYLRKLPDGDKLVIVYLKMQLKSLRTEGFIKYDKILPSNEEELAMILDEDINIVKLTIGALIQTKVIEQLDDGSFYMIAMQNLIGKEGQSAERVRQFRERQKVLALQCNEPVTKCNTEIEIEKDIYSPSEDEQDKKLKEKQLVEDFDKIWNIYPRKEGKSKAFKSYKVWLTGKKVCGNTVKLTNKQIWFAVKKYADESKEKEKTFIKMGSTFFTDAIFDYVEEENE